MLGTYLMYFAVAISGLGVLGVAVAYCFRPTERKLALMRPLSLASIFAALASLTAGWAYVLRGAAATEWSALDVQRVLMGSSQTLIPVFVTFAILSVAWLFVATGLRRTGASRTEPPPSEEIGDGPPGARSQGA